MYSYSYESWPDGPQPVGLAVVRRGAATAAPAGVRRPSLAMADLVDVSPPSFQIVDDGGAPLTVAVRRGPRFEGALFGGEAIGPLFPHDTYEGQCSLLGDHGFSPPEGDWWVEAGHPVQPAMWAAAWFRSS